MIFMSYDDNEEGRRGLVFFYPSQDKSWIFESDNTNKDQIVEINKF